MVRNDREKVRKIDKYIVAEEIAVLPQVFEPNMQDDRLGAEGTDPATGVTNPFASSTFF